MPVRDEDGAKRRGRPKGIARQIAEDTGLSIRTVQRALASKAATTEPAEDISLRRFLETFRIFASFCRDNDADAVAKWSVTDEQARKLRNYNDTVTAWLRRLNGGD